MVDGKPIAEAPKVERSKTILETDDEFDGGSKLTFTALTPLQIENLATLCKVWGFVKYHHPALTAAKRHWDYDLFRFLPTVLKATDRAAANEAMLKWIESLGEVPACTACATPPAADRIALQPDVRWIDSAATLGAGLSRALQNIYSNRTAGKQFFVSQAPNVRNPNFDIEPAYSGIHLPDPGYQLLGLFKVLEAALREILGNSVPQTEVERIARAGRQ